MLLLLYCAYLLADQRRLIDSGHVPRANITARLRRTCCRKNNELLQRFIQSCIVCTFMFVFYNLLLDCITYRVAY